MTRFFSTVLMLFALMGLPDQASAQDSPLYQKIQALAWKQAPALGATNCKCAYTTPTKWLPLGAELRELAERKTKDITEAYRQGMAWLQR